jgi:Tfp pilus assembly protein PilF
VTGTAARIGIALAAVVVVAWLVVMERNTRLESNSLNAAGKHQIAKALHDAHQAGLLNPDTAPTLRRGLIYFTQGNGQAARAALDSVLSKEPDNLQAWSGVLALSRQGDPAGTRRALAAIKRLDPLDAPSR